MSKLTKKQVKTYSAEWQDGAATMRLIAKVRHDDECGNGHNSFAITADLYDSRVRRERGLVSCGCLHDDIEKHIPELSPYLKWHLTSTDGPMHYVANTMYHASPKDCNGLLKGEFRSFKYEVQVNGEAVYASRVFYSFRNWLHRDEARAQADAHLELIRPELRPEIIRVGDGAPSEGKEPNLEHARSSAVWPDATLEQLSNKQALLDRLPDLMAEFQSDVESLGLVY